MEEYLFRIISFKRGAEFCVQSNPKKTLTLRAYIAHLFGYGYTVTLLFLVVHHFRKKIHIIDICQGPKCGSGDDTTKRTLLFQQK